MKQQIMEKLFNEKTLTNEEILYIGSKLDDQPVVTTGKGRRKKGSLKPYDHSIKDSLGKACGLDDKDFDDINKLIRSELMDKKGEVNSDSKQIEVLEKIALAKPVNLRLILYQYTKMKGQLENKPSSGSGSFRLGGGDFRDFLDFLKGQGGG